MAKVTSKGQITIPVSIRRRLNINEGDKLLFIDSPDGVVMINPDMLAGERGTIIPEFGIRNPEPAVAQTPGAPAQKDNVAAAASTEQAATTKTAPQSEPLPSIVEPAPVTDAPEATASDIPAEPPEEMPEKPGSQVRGYDLGALLDEIRTIGSNI